MELDLQRYTNYTNSYLLVENGIGDGDGKEAFHFRWNVWFFFFFSKDNIISNNGIKKKYKTVDKQLLL